MPEQPNELDQLRQLCLRQEQQLSTIAAREQQANVAAALSGAIDGAGVQFRARRRRSDRRVIPSRRPDRDHERRGNPRRPGLRHSRIT